MRPGAPPRDEDDLARRTAHAFGLARRAGRRRGCQRRPARGGARAASRRRSDGQARRVAGGRDVRSKTRWLAGFLQFAPRIACRRVLHRRRSQEIRCRGLCLSPRGCLPRQGGEGGLSRGPKNSEDVSCETVAAFRAADGLEKEEKEFAGRGGPAPPCNDPSAGSPTETLLRLLLPLGDQVRTASRPRAVVADRPPAGPEASPGRPIGSSDGRCVQRAGT